jgi:glycosyltransferase involved in cell wall biosynthesis
MKPSLSIVIPTLNEELFLPLLLNDLCEQKEKNFEVVIVDAKSEDQTKLYALQFKDRIPLSFFETNQKNVSFQRNLGVSHTNGQYLIFLDADSRINSAFTHKLEKAIKSHKGLFFIPTLKTDSTDLELQFAFEVMNLAYQIASGLSRPFALGGAMILEKNFFNLINGFNEKLLFAEDSDIARRAYLWNVRIKYLSEVAVTYSIRRIKKEGKLKSFYKYFLATVNYLVHGKIENKLFEYEMGGQFYKNKNKTTDINSLKKIFTKAKNNFIKFINNN